ncbi:hypothetical protein [Microbacterium sp. 2RAF4]|uniref:hypothetical protein n=1 Tax=Microbacterium sp. 2RAF4 TaxID=3232999 RepID=UPI003F9591C9
MPDAAELAELRSLQARAYGRDASLTAAEALRLRDLERRGAEPTPVVAAPPIGAPVETPTPGTGNQEPRTEDLPGSVDGEATTSGMDPGDPGGSGRPPARSRLRTRWLPLAAAVATLVLVGVGLGWALSGGSAPATVALSSEQQEWQSALLASGNYDRGSLRALAVEEGAVIWVATRDAAAITCLLVATSPSALPSCERTETVGKTGLFGAVTLESKAETRRELNVQMVFTASGVPAVAANVAEFGPGTTNGMTWANADEAEKATRIADQGFQINSLWVVGYDGDVPVWTGMELDGFQTCLIYDGSDVAFPRVCADALTMQEQSATLVLNVVDDTSGEVVRLELPTASNGHSSLMITREGGADGAAGD